MHESSSRCSVTEGSDKDVGVGQKQDRKGKKGAWQLD